MINLDYVGSLTDIDSLAGELAATGLSSQACVQKAKLFAESAKYMSTANVTEKQHAFFVPGRIEVLGKHTDYAGGRTVVAAAERGFCVVFAERPDDQVVVLDTHGQRTARFQLDPNLVPTIGDWSNYPMTVARRVARNFPDARRGVTISFASDLPPAAGMSSSSAMMIAIFLAISHVNELPSTVEYRDNIKDQTDLAGYLGTIENGQTFGTLEGDRGVGTFGGSEDHTAILCSCPNQISQYAYCPVVFERAIDVPSDYTFVIGSSGVVAEKTGAARDKYNNASALASKLVELWCDSTKRDDPHLAAVLASISHHSVPLLRQKQCFPGSFQSTASDEAVAHCFEPSLVGEKCGLASSPDAANRLEAIVAESNCNEFTPKMLARRLAHFRTENEDVIPPAGDALCKNDMNEFGYLVDLSQDAAARLLGNQVPQTVFLASSARQLGAAAASAFGAGFGGSVWALVKTADVDSFLTNWAKTYQAEFPTEAELSSFFHTAAGPASFQVC